jgi:O-antigen/teichoic acid export membrane protein
LLGYITQYGLNAFLAQNLAKGMYGDFGTTLKILSITTSLALFGTDIGTDYFVSKYLFSGQKVKAERYIVWNIALLRNSYLFFLLLATVSFLISFILHLLGFYSIYKYHFFVYILWITPLVASFRIVTMLLRASNLNVFASFGSTLLIYVLQFCFFFLLIKFSPRHSHHLYSITILGLSNLIIAILMFFKLDRKFRETIFLELRHSSKITITNTYWYKKSKHIISNNLIFLMITSIDLFIVRIFSKNSQDLGLYTAVLATTSILSIIPGSLNQNIQSKISYLLSSTSGKFEVEKQLRVVNRIIFFILSIGSVFILYFSTELLQVFGNTYIRAKSVLIYITIAVWFLGITQSAMTILTYTGFNQLVRLINSIKLISICLIVTPATYLFGLNGTGLSMLIILTVFQCCFVYFAKEKTGVRAYIL